MTSAIETLKTWITESDNIVFFGGAGVSTESGIPDFRSTDGLYHQKFDYPPETILSHTFFYQHPEYFFKFYREKMLPLDYQPNEAHKKLAALEQAGKLRAIVTQNIDGLHQKAGSKCVYELHGSVYRNYCEKCGKFYPPEYIRDSAGVPRCTCGGRIKPDVVLYEESLDQTVIEGAVRAIADAEVLIVGGTSLTVYPAAGLIRYYRGNKLVLINRDETPYDTYANLIFRDPIGKVLGAICTAMTRTEFSAWCKTVHLLDGATGSMLRRAGMPAGVCSETWILDHPQTLIALQRAYLAAGSEIIYAPTFGANRVLLGHHDLQREVRALNRDLVQLGREAVGTSALLAGDMTTTGRPVTPGDDSAYETLLEIYREQAEALLEAGVDLFAVETMMGVTECMAAIEAIRSLCETPILCTLSVYSDGKCYFDGSAEEAAELLPGLGADAVGINCSSGPDQMGSVVRMMHRAAGDTPIAAKPNAGLPTITETGEAVYSMGPEAFVRHMQALKASGAALLGGCCGTTPEFIAAMRSLK